MARWWRRRAAEDGEAVGAEPPRSRQEHEDGREHGHEPGHEYGDRPPGPPQPGPDAQEPAHGSGNARRLSGGRLTLTDVTEGRPEQEIISVQLSAEEIRTMRARSAIDTLGPEHPDTLVALRELAEALLSVPGRGAEAVELYQHVARTQWTTLGERHEETLRTSAELAGALHTTGQLSLAETAWRDTFRAQAETLGRDHPDTLRSATRLAAVLQDLGRAPEAEPLVGDVLARRVRQLGRDHPDVLSTTNAHAAALDRKSVV